MKQWNNVEELLLQLAQAGSKSSCSSDAALNMSDSMEKSGERGTQKDDFDGTLEMSKSHSRNKSFLDRESQRESR